MRYTIDAMDCPLEKIQINKELIKDSLHDEEQTKAKAKREKEEDIKQKILQIAQKQIVKYKEKCMFQRNFSILVFINNYYLILYLLYIIVNPENDCM